MDIDIYTKLTAIIDLSRLKLARVLKNIPGTKDITLEPNLIRPLERICGAKWLRLHDVEKIYKFEDKTPVHSNSIHVYFIPANLLVFQRVLDQIQALLRKNSSIKYHIIVIPKVLVSLEVLLEQIGLYDIVTLHSYCWDFIQIDNGILSLELPNLFGDIFCNGDWSLLPLMGKSLSTLFCVTGRPRVTVTIGKHSISVLKHLDLFTDHLNLPPKEDSDFEAFIIMDRSADYITPLLTPTTYAGLLAETYKVRCGIVEEVPEETEAPQSSKEAQSSAKITALFTMDSSNDIVYKDIKDRHISEVSDILSGQARQLKSEAEVSKEMALSEIKTFVQSKLQQVSNKSRFLSLHLKACERIIEKLGSKIEKIRTTEQSLIENIDKGGNIRSIEHLILRGDEYISLRLMCLMALTQKMSYDEYHSLRLQYLHQFGYNFLHIFDGLITAGLIQEPVQTKLSLSLSLPIGSKKDFYSMSKKLKLIPEKPDEMSVRAPTCPSYAFGGHYIPLLAQLVMSMIQAQTEKEFKTKLDLLEGTISSQGAAKSLPLQRRTFLVCVVGGFTYAEVSALSLVEKLCSCKVVVCSNSMVSGNDLMEATKS